MHRSKSFTYAVTRKHIQPFKCDRGPFFQVANLNGNLTQFRPSEIHYLRENPLHEKVVKTWDDQKCEELISSVFDRLEKQS